jgi:hypothetical protein
LRGGLLAAASVTFHHGCFYNGSAEYWRARCPLRHARSSRLAAQAAASGLIPF